MRKTTIIYMALYLVLILNCKAQTITNKSIIAAHAHNDYKNERPLLDALEFHFKSVEADVYSKGDSLFVAHDVHEIKPGYTLQKLYLNPLKSLIKKNGGSVYGDGKELILLVDIKDDGIKTYQLLHRILEPYKELLTTYHSGMKLQGAIAVIVSGNRPFEFIKQQDERYAAYDGRISDLVKEIPPSLMPLVSDNWNNHFKWRGQGDMPQNEKEKLDVMIRQTHEKGAQFRFWATPDRPGPEREAVWTALKNAGIDLIGTDDLKGLYEFFIKE